MFNMKQHTTEMRYVFTDLRADETLRGYRRRNPEPRRSLLRRLLGL